MTSLVLDIGNLSDKYKLYFTYYWLEQTSMHMLTKFI